MSLHYVLDGYNIVKQTPRFCAGTLEDNRRALLSYLAQHAPQGSANNDVTVVFDGQGGLGGWGEYAGGSAGVRVVFSSTGDADELIKRLVGESAHPRSMVVVTDDREIFYYVRSLGAKVLGVKAFLGQSRSARKPEASSEKQQTGIEQKRISATMEHEITQELSRLWVRRARGKNKDD